MCDNHSNNNNKKRLGRSLEDGKKAHEQDHKKWSRRNFLVNSGIFTLGSALMFGKSPVQALAASPMLKALNAADNEKVLVIINLDGGNDGLNTIVPRGNSTYYNLRPNLAIQEADMTPLSDEYGMPNFMSELLPLWNEGKMNVIHSVAYPDQNYSHFRSADIWSSGSAANELVTTGWIGRFLDYEFPSFNSTPANFPVGLQVGTQSSLIFMGGNNSLGLTINNPTQFYEIAQTGQLYNTSGLPDCSYGDEVTFLRETANNTYRYAETIREAYTKSTDYAGYDAENPLSEQLNLVSRMIKGRLGTKIYLVHLGGFDTHAAQPVYHPTLMNYVANAVKSFYDDLTEAGHINEVLTMTVSEFGRTNGENASYGTDHGQAAPLFIFGENITGGFIGEFGDLPEVAYMDQKFTTDFRSVYSSILKDWFCIDKGIVDSIMGDNFPLVPNLLPNCEPSLGSNNAAALLGHNPQPTSMSTMLIKYAILRAGLVRLSLLDSSGKVRATLVNEAQAPNSYTIPVSASAYGLPSGEYIYKLEAGGKAYTRTIRLF